MHVWNQFNQLAKSVAQSTTEKLRTILTMVVGRAAWEMRLLRAAKVPDCRPAGALTIMFPAAAPRVRAMETALRPAPTATFGT